MGAIEGEESGQQILKSGKDSSLIERESCGMFSPEPMN